VILLDLNVILDVVQKREPHYRASAAVMEAVVRRRVSALIPAHAVTTVHYIVGRHRDQETANGTVDWLLRYFDVATVGRGELLRARALGWADFEDAVVAAAAESAGCAQIVTRNVKDFMDSPLPAVTPEEFLLGSGEPP
jgi:predicted nucleic acid-binding protein